MIFWKHRKNVLKTIFNGQKRGSDTEKPQSNYQADNYK